MSSFTSSSSAVPNSTVGSSCSTDPDNNNNNNTTSNHENLLFSSNTSHSQSFTLSKDLTASSSRSDESNFNLKLTEVRLSTAKELFNFPIQEIPIILDLRNGMNYIESHIQGAISCPVVANLSNIAVVESRIKGFLDSIAPEHTRTIFVYGALPDAITTYQDNILDICIEQYPLIRYLQENGLASRSYDTNDVESDGTHYLPLDCIRVIPSFAEIQRILPFHILMNTDDIFPDDEEVCMHFYPSMIREHALFLGSYQQSIQPTVLQHLDIDVILNITIECKTPEYVDHPELLHKAIEYHRFPALDLSRQDMTKVWIEVAKHMHQSFAEDKRVLIHCHAGKSRSASCIMFYLMYYEQYSLKEAYREVVRCRPCVSPNSGFMYQLKEWERFLLETPAQPTPLHTEAFANGEVSAATNV